MKLDIDKEFIQWKVTKSLNSSSYDIREAIIGWDDPLRDEYYSYKRWYDQGDLIAPNLWEMEKELTNRSDYVRKHYKKGIVEIVTQNPYAYFNWQKKEFSHWYAFLADPERTGNYKRYNPRKKEIERLTEEEREKWIKRLGKSWGTLDGKFNQEWIESEKLQWILSTKENHNYWLDLEIEELEVRKDIPRGQVGYLKTNEKAELKRYKKFKENNNKDNSWSGGLEQPELLKNNKWVKLSYPNSSNPRLTIINYAKDSSEALIKIFNSNDRIYIDIPQTTYDIFSVHESKSNFNLLHSLINKHWREYIQEQGNGKDLIWDITLGRLKDPEVEMLGFKRYPELKQEVESKKDNSEQTNKFEAPKLKMKM
ncbi:hypothetical protein [Mesomycoplasma ovipneumoniae]|uniref:hypothetical protein n=1 Tax=Mesomycoplasma ovipneumoniae TaxID=29562 RepID=UPI00308000C1